MRIKLKTKTILRTASVLNCRQTKLQLLVSQFFGERILMFQSWDCCGNLNIWHVRGGDGSLWTNGASLTVGDQKMTSEGTNHLWLTMTMNITKNVWVFDAWSRRDQRRGCNDVWSRKNLTHKHRHSSEQNCFHSYQIVKYFTDLHLQRWKFLFKKM